MSRRLTTTVKSVVMTLMIIGAGACSAGPEPTPTPPPTQGSNRSSTPSTPGATATRTAQWSFFVVRHADRANDGSDDPPLTTAGTQRAGRLAGLLTPHQGVGVYATDFTRTQRTAAPTAEAWQVPVTTYDGTADAAQLIGEIKQQHPQGAILIVGHSDTVPTLVGELCRCDVSPIGESEFGNLYEVDLAADSAVLKAEHLPDY